MTYDISKRVPTRPTMNAEQLAENVCSMSDPMFNAEWMDEA